MTMFIQCITKLPLAHPRMLAVTFFIYLEVGINVIQFSMPQHQANGVQINAVGQQAAGHCSSAAVATAVFYAGVPVELGGVSLQGITCGVIDLLARLVDSALGVH